MLDLGIIENKEYDDEGYERKYLSDLKPGDIIEGEIKVTELKENEYQGTKKHQFFVIIKNHSLKVTYVCGIPTTVYETQNNEPVIYGKKGGRAYTFIDSLQNVLNPETPQNSKPSYTLKFETFQKTVNEQIETATINFIASNVPAAKSPNLKITQVTLKEDTTSYDSISPQLDLEKELSEKEITQLKEKNPTLGDVISIIYAENIPITLKNIANELKEMEESREIDVQVKIDAYKDIDKIIKSK